MGSKVLKMTFHSRYECERCGDPVGGELHCCPYREEFLSPDEGPDYNYCNCCNKCVMECAGDI